MGWLSWIVPGLIVGLIARVVVRPGRRFGCLGTILLGIIGSFVGGLIGSVISNDGFDLSPAGWVGSIIGAIVVLVIVRGASREPSTGSRR
jgi:uncharacterized membrane protein YeaQ/YmgE (transglycosylase-associated protein family)